MENNWYEWQSYVNDRLDELFSWKQSKEQDQEMASLRLQRLLDAALQRLGEKESEVQKLQEENAYLERKSA